MKTVILMLITIAFVSCKNNKEQASKEVHNDHHGNMEKHKSHDEAKADYSVGNSSQAYSMFIQDYLELKEALIVEDVHTAAKAGNALVKSIENLDIESYQDHQKDKLMEIIKVIKEHSEHIAKSDIEHQREYFNDLSIKIVNLLAITGTPNTLYEQYCPMYNNNKGGTWISAEKEIRNPFFGSKMMKCGSVKKEIN